MAPAGAFGEEAREVDVLVLIQRRAQEIGLGLQELAVANPEHDAACVFSIALESEDVGVFPRAEDLLLMGDDPLNGRDLVSNPCRLLEAQILGVLVHAAVELLEQGAALTLEEESNLVNQLAIALLIHVADTRGAAAMDVVVEARSRHGLPGQVELAGADGKDGREGLEREPHRLDVGVGAEVVVAVVGGLSHDVDARERLAAAEA